jgi:hypothetical protein
MDTLRFSRGLSLLLAVVLLPLSLAGQSAHSPGEGGFIAGLTAAEQAAAGLSRLTDQQRVTLNDLVAREVRLARQGDVIAFAGTFSTRRPASEFIGAGLTALTTDETAALDGYVARLLAQRPPVVYFRSQPDDGTVETVTRRPQWHGEITATYGRGSGGREFYGGSVTTIYDDPDRGFAAALTLAQYRGDGYFFGGPGYGYGYGPGFGYGYPCGPGLGSAGWSGRRR